MQQTTATQTIVRHVELRYQDQQAHISSLQSFIEHFEGLPQAVDALERAVGPFRSVPTDPQALPLLQSQRLHSFHSTHQTNLHIDTVRSSGIPCPTRCLCKCHSTTRLGSPQCFEPLTGSLRLNFRGLPWRQPICNLPSCKRMFVTTLAVQYRFPSWFANTILSAWFRRAPVSGSMVLLRVAREQDSGQFNLIWNLDLPGLKALYANGMVSIYDQHPYNRESALSVSLKCCRLIMAIY